MQSIGEKRVRVDFNVSKSSVVDEIKTKTAELINLLEELKNNISVESEFFRLVAVAQTSYEESAMWAVKAATFKS